MRSVNSGERLVGLQKLLGLKIDVDTYEGMRRGVPALLKTMDRLGVKGTFYLSIGPDASGMLLFSLTYQACDDRRCLASTAVELPLQVRVAGKGKQPRRLHPDIFGVAPEAADSKG